MNRAALVVLAAAAPSAARTDTWMGGALAGNYVLTEKVPAEFQVGK